MAIINKFNVIFIIIFILSILNVTAFSTDLLDGVEYRPTDTITLEVVTLTNPEKGDPYLVEWYNSTGALLQSNAGTLSTVIGGVKFETYTTSINDQWINAYVEITANTVTQTIYFNVSGNASNSLIIIDPKFSPFIRLGSSFAVDFKVTDETGIGINNAVCDIFGSDSNGQPLQRCTVNSYSKSFNGRVICDGLLDPIAFTENTEYLVTIRCTCGIGVNSCFNENGEIIEKHAGSIAYIFNVTPWLYVNTITDKSLYSVDDSLYICANVTNNIDIRLPLQIVYSFRCQNGGGDSSTERILLGSKVEERGISSNTTQNQCNSFLLIDDEILELGDTKCYASTSVTVLNKNKEKIYTYDTTSEIFNINVTEINPYVKWNKITENVYTGIISMDIYNVGIKDVDVRINERITAQRTPSSTIKDYSVTYENGSSIPYEYEIQIVESTRAQNQYSEYIINYFDEVTVTLKDVNTNLNESFKVTLELSGIKTDSEDSQMLAIMFYGLIYIIIYCGLGFWNLKLSQGKYDNAQYWFGIVGISLGFIQMINMSGLIYSDYAGFDISRILYLGFIINLLIGTGLAAFTFWKSTVILIVPDGYVSFDEKKFNGKNKKW